MKAKDLPFEEYHALRMSWIEKYTLMIFKGYEPERAFAYHNESQEMFEIFYPYTDDAIIEAMNEIEGRLK